MPSDAALVLPSTLTSPQHHAVPYPYAAPRVALAALAGVPLADSPPHSPTRAPPRDHADGYGMSAGNARLPAVPVRTGRRRLLAASAASAAARAELRRTPRRRAAGGPRSIRLWAAGARGAAPASSSNGAALSRPSPRAPRWPAASLVFLRARIIRRRRSQLSRRALAHRRGRGAQIVATRRDSPWLPPSTAIDGGAGLLGAGLGAERPRREVLRHEVARRG